MNKEILHTSASCKICGAPALYKYFGATACNSCKMFFKRNGEAGLEIFKCDFGGNCEINVNNRHVCTACRLAKCFSNGMCARMIRCSRSKKNVKVVPTNKAQLIPALNLLRSDQSGLNIDQWNLISNLVHCYEEHSSLAYAKCFMQVQENLPLKLRFKMASIREMFTLILGGVQQFFVSNLDFLSLDSHDRSTLLRYAMENVGGLGSVLVLRQIGFLEIPGFIKTVEDIYGPIVMNLTKRLINEVDRDVTLVKLGIAMFAFSTANYSNYTNVDLNHLKNIKNILRIQDMYAEVTWKYLLYKYNHTQAVLHFFNFIRCLLIVSTAIIETQQAQYHKRMINDIVEKIDQALTINT